MPGMQTARILATCAALALVAASSCTVWKEKPANAWSGATGAEQFEKLMWQDVKNKDWADFERHLAPNFLSVDATGTRDRRTMMESVKAIVLTDYSLGDFKVETNGADFVVTYTVRLSGTWNGQPLPSAPLTMMTVWQQVTKGWMAIAHGEAVKTGP
jgi:hypothetical protein